MSLAHDWTKEMPEEAETAAKFAAILSSRRFDAKNPPPPRSRFTKSMDSASARRGTSLQSQRTSKAVSPPSWGHS